MGPSLPVDLLWVALWGLCELRRLQALTDQELLLAWDREHEAEESRAKCRRQVERWVL